VRVFQATKHIRFVCELGGVFFLGGLLPRSSLVVWLLFVAVMRIFMAARISRAHLQQGHLVVLQFLRKMEARYGVRAKQS